MTKKTDLNENDLNEFVVEEDKEARKALMIKKLTRELNSGFTIKMAAERLGIEYSAAIRYRKSIKISNKEVLGKRHKKWAELAEKGVPLKEVATTYGVTEETVKNTLWTKLNVVVTSSKQEQRKAIKENIKLKIMSGLQLGFECKMIAERLNINYNRVVVCRQSLGLSNKDILENRYKTWAELINKGVSVEAISAKYNVKVETIRQLLWKKEKFSFKESKMINRKRIETEMMQENKNPFSFDQ